MTQRKKLPIGIQTLSHIIEGGFYYVDKTAHAFQLIETGKHYFLSRPRRFGKSLFLDTLKEIFEGNEKLFQGLAIHEQWDWSVKYPVLKFSFGSGHFSSPEGLQEQLSAQLDRLEKKYSFQTPFTEHTERFSALIEHVKVQTGKPVVILIDEYDKPILDAIEVPDIAHANGDVLRGFYATIKNSDTHIKFSFVTGVTKLSKASVFSGLSHVEDISLNKNYSALFGYTDHDLDAVFSLELEGLDRDEVRTWYKGYNWLGESVYNPIDILQLLGDKKFRNYWFETGTPTFLIDWIIEHKIASPKLHNLISSSTLLSSFDVNHMTLETLLFQTGYLTIKKSQTVGGQILFTLDYPNQEVYQSLNESLLSTLIKNSEQGRHSLQLYEMLMRNDFDGLQQLFHSFFASIPHHWYNSNTIQEYEGYYASVFYSYFAALGLDVTVEDCTNLGRIDMTLKFNNQVYIFEFKVVELTPKGKALQQIKDKGYADKYKDLKQTIHLISVEFSKETRNIEGFEREELTA